MMPNMLHHSSDRGVFLEGAGNKFRSYMAPDGGTTTENWPWTPGASNISSTWKLLALDAIFRKTPAGKTAATPVSVCSEFNSGSHLPRVRLRHLGFFFGTWPACVLWIWFRLGQQAHGAFLRYHLLTSDQSSPVFRRLLLRTEAIDCCHGQGGHASCWIWYEGLQTWKALSNGHKPGACYNHLLL